MNRNNTDNSGKPSQQVYYISLIITFIIVAWAIFAQTNFTNTANYLLNSLTNNFGWAYLLSMSIFVVSQLF